jgi:hypothetical protein
LKGKEDGHFPATIRSEKSSPMKIRSSKRFGKSLSMNIGSLKIFGKPLSMRIRALNRAFGKIRFCLIYELVRDGQERMAIMRNYRVLLAVEVFTMTITNTCTASVALFMVKSRSFTGEIDDIECLHNDVLIHHRVVNGSSFKYNLAGRILKLDVDFQPARQAKIKVVLKETYEYHEYGPVFYRVNSFA